VLSGAQLSFLREFVRGEFVYRQFAIVRCTMYVPAGGLADNIKAKAGQIMVTSSSLILRNHESRARRIVDCI
jgi:hypothetical protein